MSAWTINDKMRQSANRICIMILNGMQQGGDDEYPETHDCYAAAFHGDGYVAKVLKIAEQIYRSEVE